MDSVNKKTVQFAFVSALIGTVLFLGGCGPSSSMVKESASSPLAALIPKKESKPKAEKVAPEAVLVDSLKYLPSQGYDKTGNKIPYTGAANPYLETKGQIPQTEVNLYIAAISANQRGHLELARKKLEKLTEMASDLSGPWVKLGQVAKKEEKIEEAEQHFRKAIEINKDNVNAYIDLALIQREQGKFVEAQNTYVAALKVWPDFPEAHLNLGVLYDLYLNNPENAQAHYEAYQFLTESKNTTVADWLSEVKQRTGIMESFIDTPPLPSKVTMPAAKEKKSDVETANL